MGPHPCKQLRTIVSELRRALPDKTKLTGNQGLRFILTQYRKNATTQEQVCRHKEEMAFLADTYSTYLSSQRHYWDLQQEYHAKGERTVDEAAKMVGFNLPHEEKLRGKQNQRLINSEDFGSVFESQL